uniref:HDC13594 n=1 Tax=Drosophila melanogaster TaxID=7227 RepID=Q6IK17_DROME|nr:TPA_inf: HDC13594 [Drosophila melanogaster]
MMMMRMWWWMWISKPKDDKNFDARAYNFIRPRQLTNSSLAGFPRGASYKCRFSVSSHMADILQLPAIFYGRTPPTTTHYFPSSSSSSSDLTASTRAATIGR